MPRIQPIRSRTQARSIGGLAIRTATAADFGGSVGAAAQQAGSELSRQADFLHQKEEEDAQRWRRKSLAQFELQQTEAFTRGQETAERGGVGFVQGFQGGFDKAGEGLLASAPTERARADLEVDLARIKAGFVSKGIQFEARARGVAARQDLQEIQGARTNAVLLDPSSHQDHVQAMVEEIQSQPGLNDTDRTALIGRVENDFKIAQAQGFIDGATTVDAAEGVLEHLKDPEFSRSIDPGNYSKLLGLAERNIDHREREEVAKEAEADKAASTQRTVEFNQLLVAMAQGRATEADIDAFRTRFGADQDAAAATQWRQLAVAMAKDKRAAAKAAAGEARAIASQAVIQEAYMSGDRTFDPGDKNVRKAVDKHFERVSAQWAELPGDEQAEQVVAYVSRLGVVPSAVKSQFRAANVASANPDIVVGAAELMERLDSANPTVLASNGIGGKSVSFLTQVREYQRAGSEPVDAVAKAREMRFVPKAVVDDRRATVSAILKDAPAADYLREKFDDGWFGDDVSPSVEAVRAFEREFKDEYALSGDSGPAQEAAFRNFRRTWGVSGINGEVKLSKHAPEVHYSVPGLSREENTAWMLKQLRSDLGEGSIGFEDQRVMVVPHPSVKGPDGRPAYRVAIVGAQDGTLKEQPGAWFPDFERSDIRAGQLEERKRLLDEARVDRDLESKGIPTIRLRDDFGVLGEILNE